MIGLKTFVNEFAAYDRLSSFSPTLSTRSKVNTAHPFTCHCSHSINHTFSSIINSLIYFAGNCHLCPVWLFKPGLDRDSNCFAINNGSRASGRPRPGRVPGLRGRVHGLLPDCLRRWNAHRYKLNIFITDDLLYECTNELKI